MFLLKDVSNKHSISTSIFEKIDDWLTKVYTTTMKQINREIVIWIITYELMILFFMNFFNPLYS